MVELNKLRTILNSDLQSEQKLEALGKLPAVLARVKEEKGVAVLARAMAHQAMAKRGTFNPNDAASWPPEVRAAMERVAELQAEAAFAALPHEAQQAWMGLADIYEAQLRVGVPVRLTGLTNANAGLNGRRGVVVGNRPPSHAAP